MSVTLELLDRDCILAGLTDTARACWAFAYFDAPLPDRLASQTSPASAGDPDEEDTL